MQWVAMPPLPLLHEGESRVPNLVPALPQGGVGNPSSGSSVASSLNLGLVYFAVCWSYIPPFGDLVATSTGKPLTGAPESHGIVAGLRSGVSGFLKGVADKAATSLGLDAHSPLKLGPSGKPIPRQSEPYKGDVDDDGAASGNALDPGLMKILADLGMDPLGTGGYRHAQCCIGRANHTSERGRLDGARTY